MGLSRPIFFFIIVLSLIAAVVFGLYSCGRKEEVILARVEGETITLAEFEDRISRLPEQYQVLINKNRERFLDDFIIELLMCKEAVSLGIDKQKDTREILKEAKRKILMAKFIEEEVEKKVSVNEAELRDYYKKNRDKFVVPERMRASHILVKSEEKAAELLAKISGGADFGELATAESIDITNRRGGDIGYFTRGQLVPEFEEACAKLEIGQVSPTVKTSFGFHIIKLTDRKPSYIKEFEELKDEIGKEVSSLKRRERFSSVVQSLKQKASIEINTDLLKRDEDETD